jgi:hypothetical protein
VKRLTLGVIGQEKAEAFDASCSKTREKLTTANRDGCRKLETSFETDASEHREAMRPLAPGKLVHVIDRDSRACPKSPRAEPISLRIGKAVLAS